VCVLSVSFPDGSLLASSSWDKTVKVWDVGSGRETSAQQLFDAIGSKDSVIEEQKTLLMEKDTLLREKNTLIEELKIQIEEIQQQQPSSAVQGMSSSSHWNGVIVGRR
jgi:WD40 repeat protein